jgi:hypothetical protein
MHLRELFQAHAHAARREAALRLNFASKKSFRTMALLCSVSWAL